jgi:predicted aspartyl protease
MMFERGIRYLSVLAATIASLTLTCIGESSVPRHSGTVPMDVRDNRVFIDLRAVRANGSTRTARFWVDTGGGAVILSEALAHDLRLTPVRPSMQEGKNTFLPVTSPQIEIGGMRLNFDHVAVLVSVGSTLTVMPGSGADGILPGRLLKKYEAVFDYPKRKFTLALPGTLKNQGTPVPTPIQRDTGFPRIEATVAGQRYGFLLDTGAAYTMVSHALMDRWLAANPGWPHSEGAVGPANMVGQAFDAQVELLRIPAMEIGPFQLRGVGVGSRQPGTFETYLAPLMTGPIVGSLAGNVLRCFRVQIDYAHGVTYLEMDQNVRVNGLDVVGIVVRAQPGGTYSIDGVAKKDGKAVIDDVRSGDTLLQVGGWRVTGASLADVLRALRGKPGSTKTLVVERGGRRLTISVPVTHLP